MAGCCNQGCDLDGLRDRQRGTLRVVLGINVVMFFAVVVASLHAGSASLLSISLDNLGDALTYGLSLYVVARGTGAKARAALFKGVLIGLAALGVAAQIGYKLVHPSVPIFETMGLMSLLSLAANGLCLYLLWKHRTEDVNMSSVWECSRNDIAGDVAVFVAAFGVWAVGSQWPDVLVALGLLALLLRSSWRVIGRARAELAAASR